MSTCVICYDENIKCGIQCCNLEEPHNICIICFNNYIKDQELFPKISDIYKLQQCIPCVLCDNNYPTRKSIENIEFLQLYIDIELKVQEQLVRHEIMVEVTEAKITRNYKTKVYNDICDIATTCKKCPYCTAPFFEFVGCMALHCISCNKQFCGFCLQIHNDDDGISNIEGETASGRCHKYVKSHTDIFSSFQKREMGITSTYFMNTELWRNHIRDTVMFNLIKEYLDKIKPTEIYPIMDMLIESLDITIISATNKIKLKQFLCSSGAEFSHMIRLPSIFATIFSHKKNRRIEDSMGVLSPPQKISMGGAVVKKINEKYPGWNPHKVHVPGENFDSISYPTFMYDDIYYAIMEWGKSAKGASLWD